LETVKNFISIMANTFAKIVYSVLATSLGDVTTDESSLLQAKMLKHHNMLQNRSECTLPGSYCVVQGDPHVKPFDEGGQHEMCLGPMGDYVLVQTADLYIHARYQGFMRDSGYAFIKGLVLGGGRFGGKKLSVPILNTGAVEYDGVPLPAEGIDTPSLRIWKKEGPNLIGFGVADIINTDWTNTYWIELKKNGLVDVLIVINQGDIQHIMISGTQGALAGTTGQCGNYNNDPTDDTIAVDDCVGKTDTCEFPVCPNPEDGKPRVPPTCTLGTPQFEFYTKVCKAHWGEAALKEKEWKLFNCVTDCCGDRDSCPDLGNEGMDGTCLVKGDPHIKTFDSDTVHKNVYAPLNDYWLVNTKFLQIQVRYGTERWDGKAQVMGVAVTGILTGGVSMYIPRGQGAVQIGGNAMNGDIYDTAAFELKYETKGENLRFKLDAKKSGKPQRLYTLTFKNPSDGKTIGFLKVNKNKNSAKHQSQTVFFKAENWILEGVSGQCGNYNSNPEDDNADPSNDLIATGQSLFPDTNPDIGKVFNEKGCTKPQAKAAKLCCAEKHNPTTKDVINACIVDHCCGADTTCDPATRCLLN